MISLSISSHLSRPGEGQKLLLLSKIVLIITKGGRKRREGNKEGRQSRRRRAEVVDGDTYSGKIGNERNSTPCQKWKYRKTCVGLDSGAQFYIGRTHVLL